MTSKGRKIITKISNDPSSERKMNSFIDSRIENHDLTISNKDSIYHLEYGQKFEGLLDARDQLLEHSFSFSFDHNDESLLKEGENMLESKLYRCIKKNVKDFLAEAVANVVSVGFKHLCKTDLEESESRSSLPTTSF